MKPSVVNKINKYIDKVCCIAHKLTDIKDKLQSAHDNNSLEWIRSCHGKSAQLEIDDLVVLIRDYLEVSHNYRQNL